MDAAQTKQLIALSSTVQSVLPIFHTTRITYIQRETSPAKVEIATLD